MVDKIVVDLSKIFAAGQAYVALRLVTILEGLQILNYNSTAIKKDKRVDTEMLRLQQRRFHYWIMYISMEFHSFKLKSVTHIIQTMTVQLLQ